MPAAALRARATLCDIHVCVMSHVYVCFSYVHQYHWSACCRLARVCHSVWDVYVCVWVQTYLHACIYVNICTYISIDTYIYTYNTHTHTHTHTHKHMQEGTTQHEDQQPHTTQHQERHQRRPRRRPRRRSRACPCRHTQPQRSQRLLFLFLRLKHRGV